MPLTPLLFLRVRGQTQSHLESLHFGDLVPDPVLQGGQGPQLSVDLYLHVNDVPPQTLGQRVILVAVIWWDTRTRQENSPDV